MLPHLVVRIVFLVKGCRPYYSGYIGCIFCKITWKFRKLDQLDLGTYENINYVHLEGLLTCNMPAFGEANEILKSSTPLSEVCHEHRIESREILRFGCQNWLLLNGSHYLISFGEKCKK